MESPVSNFLLFLMLAGIPGLAADDTQGQEMPVVPAVAAPTVTAACDQPGTLWDNHRVVPCLPRSECDSGPAWAGFLFPKDGYELQVLAGAYFAPCGLGPETPVYDFAPMTIRLGRITECGLRNGLLRGNLEPMLEFSGAPVFNGFGNFYIGASGLLRYNFVQPESRLVPYLQVGAGATYNDGFQTANQQALGQGLEFLLQAEIGMRYFMSDRWSLDIEGGLVHISNANLANRNAGINALGGSIGISYYFGGAGHPVRW
jgi:lipid A 3-O-deacylase